MKLKKNGLNTLPDSVYDLLEFNPITKQIAMLWVKDDGGVVGIATETKEDIEVGSTFPCKVSEKENVKIYSFTEAMRRLHEGDEELLFALSLHENDFNLLSLVGKYLLENRKQFVTKGVIKNFHTDFRKKIADFDLMLGEEEEEHKFKSEIMNKIYKLIHQDEEEEEEEEEVVEPFVIDTTKVEKESENEKVYKIFKQAFENINFVLNRKMDDGQRQFLKNIRVEQLVHRKRVSELYKKAVQDIDNCFEMLETSGVFQDKVKQKCMDRMMYDVHNYVLYVAEQEEQAVATKKVAATVAS